MALAGERAMPWYPGRVTRSSRQVGIRYAVPAHRADEAWELSEETMPESVLHDEAVDLLKALLSYWARRRTEAPKAFVARNLAIRWNQAHPRVGIDPDVCVLCPEPPSPHDVSSVRTWEPGHEPPMLAIEVVSENHPHKDYAVGPDKYAASGTGELWVFDPLLAGPASHGGPVRLQLWSRDDEGDFVRIYTGDGPAYSPTLAAWLVVVDEGRRLRIASDENATRFWLTAEEAERAEREAERAAKEAALARIAELEAELRSRPR